MDSYLFRLSLPANSLQVIAIAGFCWLAVVRIVFGHSSFVTECEAYICGHDSSHERHATKCSLADADTRTFAKIDTQRRCFELIQSSHAILLSLSRSSLIGFDGRLDEMFSFYFFYCICFPLSNDNAHRFGFGHLMI